MVCAWRAAHCARDVPRPATVALRRAFSVLNSPNTVSISGLRLPSCDPPAVAVELGSAIAESTAMVQSGESRIG